MSERVVVVVVGAAAVVTFVVVLVVGSRRTSIVIVGNTTHPVQHCSSREDASKINVSTVTHPPITRNSGRLFLPAQPNSFNARQVHHHGELGTGWPIADLFWFSMVLSLLGIGRSKLCRQQ